MATKRKGNNRQTGDAKEGTTVSETFWKSLTSKATWSDKDEFLDVIYWMRQILGVIIGVIWGLVPLNGIIGLLLFFAVNCLIVYLYYNNFQNVDDEEYGGATEIFKEGLMTSFATFCVSWIICYSSVQF